jgi:hypothetical protein
MMNQLSDFNQLLSGLLRSSVERVNFRIDSVRLEYFELKIKTIRYAISLVEKRATILINKRC